MNSLSIHSLAPNKDTIAKRSARNILKFKRTFFQQELPSLDPPVIQHISFDQIMSFKFQQKEYSRLD